MSTTEPLDPAQCDKRKISGHSGHSGPHGRSDHSDHSKPHTHASTGYTNPDANPVADAIADANPRADGGHAGRDAIGRSAGDPAGRLVDHANRAGRPRGLVDHRVR